MANDQWLSLTDYASKYRVSVSTLRRRIKAGQMAHRLEAGRYVLLDEPLSSTDNMSLENESALEPASPEAGSEKDEVILSSATRLLSELKRAYTSVLQEKEEQIIQLKKEVGDLKTLVRALEDDHERLRRELQHYQRP